MSDALLLVFGCAVSFIAVAGAYLYLRDSFTREERTRESQAPRSDGERPDFRKVA